MKLQELKAVIKPLIKECIKEVLLEEGLSKIIAEAKAPAPIPAATEKKPEAQYEQVMRGKKQAAQLLNLAGKGAKSLQEAKSVVREALSQGSGFDAFSGTEPLKEDSEVKGTNSGVDISDLLGANLNWKERLEGMNKKSNK